MSRSPKYWLPCSSEISARGVTGASGPPPRLPALRSRSVPNAYPAPQPIVITDVKTPRMIGPGTRHSEKHGHQRTPEDHSPRPQHRRVGDVLGHAGHQSGFIRMTARRVSIPANRFPRRRFSFSACWLLSWLAIGTRDGRRAEASLDDDQRQAAARAWAAATTGRSEVDCDGAAARRASGQVHRRAHGVVAARPDHRRDQRVRARAPPAVGARSRTR